MSENLITNPRGRTTSGTVPLGQNVILNPRGQNTAGTVVVVPGFGGPTSPDPDLDLVGGDLVAPAPVGWSSGVAVVYYSRTRDAVAVRVTADSSALLATVNAPGIDQGSPMTALTQVVDCTAASDLGVGLVSGSPTSSPYMEVEAGGTGELRLHSTKTTTGAAVLRALRTESSGHGLVGETFYIRAMATAGTYTGPLFDGDTYGGDPSALGPLLPETMAYSQDASGAQTFAHGDPDDLLGTGVASITKVMTIWTARKWLPTSNDLDQTYTVDTTTGGPRLYTGDVLTLRDLMYAAAVPSDNTAPGQLAIAVGQILQSEGIGTGAPLARFRQQMAAEADVLGYDGAEFPGTVGDAIMSPRQVADLLRRSMADPALRAMYTAGTHTIQIVGGPDPRTIPTTHTIINAAPSPVLFYVGGKTGTFGGRGHVVVAWVHPQDGTEHISVVLNTTTSVPTQRYTELRKVIAAVAGVDVLTQWSGAPHASSSSMAAPAAVGWSGGAYRSDSRDAVHIPAGVVATLPAPEFTGTGTLVLESQPEGATIRETLTGSPAIPVSGQARTVRALLTSDEYEGDYFDGDHADLLEPDGTRYTYRWMGEPHASISRIVTTSADAGIRVEEGFSHVPFVGITVDGLDPDTPSVITIWRSVPGEPRTPVQGLREVEVTAAGFYEDWAVPLGRPVTYILEVHTGFEPAVLTGTITIESDVCWLQDPLNPVTAVPLSITGHRDGLTILTGSAFKTLTRELPGQTVQTLGASVPIGLGGTRQAASRVPLSMVTTAAAQATRLRTLLGTAYPLMLRSTPRIDQLPATCHLHVDVAEEPVTTHMGGVLTRWDLVGDVVRGPSVSVLVPRWTYGQVRDLYATYGETIDGRRYLDWRRNPADLAGSGDAAGGGLFGALDAG